MEVERDFIFDPSLVLYLPLYKLDGASFMSQDAHGHLCTVTGALWTPQSRYFDGTDDYITVGDESTFKFMHGALNTSGFQFTIEMVVALDDPASSSMYIPVGTMDYGQSVTRGICFGIGNNRTLYMEITTGVYAVRILQVTSSKYIRPNDTDLHQFAFTWNQGLANANGIFYVDAVSDTPVDKSANTPDTGNSKYPLHIGVDGTHYQDLPGKIGVVRIYNRALSPLEIQHNYLAAKWRYR